ncbi:MAG: TIGR00282 family metallophosphoesterase [Candidatus Wallbacteria bacterium]|nr:TIGR00282 family metallophosphoesterase [Candidatus Wallbacteria bacterium]
MKILFIGDVFAKPGRRLVANVMPALQAALLPDLTIVNIENAAHGSGITEKTIDFFSEQEIDVYTTGNHVMEKPGTDKLLSSELKLLRPANLPASVPGRGWGVYRTAGGEPVAVINLQGNVFMPRLECPFRTMDRVLAEIGKKIRVRIVDFHAEATSEKRALAYYLDGRVSAVIGTHTHVQTADEEILPEGTAFITDAGMTGPHHSIIGVKKEIIIERFLSRMPIKFEPATGGNILCGVFLEIDPESGKAIKIKRIREKSDK